MTEALYEARQLFKSLYAGQFTKIMNEQITTILLYAGTITLMLCLLIGLALIERYRILKQGKKLKK